MVCRVSTSLRAATRASQLALQQVREVQALLPGVEIEPVAMESTGDRHLELSLLEEVADDFFTRELDLALLTGQVQIAVHSAKDLPAVLHPRLEVIALTAAADRADALVSHGNLTLSELPSGSRVATSSPLRRAQLQRLRPDLQAVSVRGDILSRLAQLDAGQFEALIVAACALQRLGLQERCCEVLPFATHDLQGQLAVVAVRGSVCGEQSLREMFAPIDVRRSWGRVYLCGAGTGESELLTLRAFNLIQKADIIIYDALLDPRFLAQFSCDKTCTGRRAGASGAMSQDEINALLYRSVFEHRHIVRLKGGDPGIFARLDEEYRYLSSRLVDVEVVSGVSAAQSAAALSAIPLTLRSSVRQVSLVSAAVAGGGTWGFPFAVSEQMLVFYMAGRRLTEIAARLLELHLPPSHPCAVFFAVGTPGQSTFFCTLGELRLSCFTGRQPVLLMAGSPIRSRSHTRLRLNTSTRPEHDRSYMSVHTPLIALTPRRLQASDCMGLLSADYLLLSSPKAAEFLSRALHQLITDPDQLTRMLEVRAICAGRTTARISGALGFRVLAFPRHDESAHGMAGLFESHPHLRGRQLRLFYPRSDVASDYLADALRGSGHQVEELVLYDNTPNPDARRVDLRNFDQIYFASPSAVRVFEQLYGGFPDHMHFICRGDTTLASLQQRLAERSADGAGEDAEGGDGTAWGGL